MLFDAVSLATFVWCSTHVTFIESLKGFLLLRVVFSVLADVDFNVSGMFAMPTPTSNHNSLADFDCGTIERKRPQSMLGTDGDVSRKDK